MDKPDPLFSSHQNRMRHVLFSAILILAVLASYSRTLNGPFVFDDIPNIRDNGFIKIDTLSWESVKYAWNARHPCKRRTVSNLSFALNYLWGGLNPAGYHIVNIVIHFSCGLLTAFFFLQILQIKWLEARYGPMRVWLAWAAALIWVLHPIQINAVTYIVQRMTSLSTLFALAALNAWMLARKYWDQKRLGFFYVYLLLAVFMWGLGLLSKEHVAIIPLFVFICEYFLFRKGSFDINWYWVLISLLIIPVFLLFYGTEPLNSIFTGYERRDFTLLQRLMTEARVLWHYVALFYVPVAERFSLLYEYPVSRTLLTPITTLPAILLWIAIAVTAWVRRQQWPVFSWMVAWFLAGHLIESTILPLEIIFEHRMYLPSVAMALGSVLLGFDFFSRHLNRPGLQVIILLGILSMLGMATYTRNLDFRDQIFFYRTEIEKFPDSDRLRLNLAVALNRRGQFGEGGKMLSDLAEDYPDDILILQNWYTFLIRIAKDKEKAGLVYQHIVALIREGRYNHHKDASAIHRLAENFQEIGEYKKALFCFDRLLTDYPRYDSLWYLKGRCYAGLTDWVSAKKAFRQAYEINPRDPVLQHWYGKSLIRIGEREKGCLLIKKVKNDPIHKDVSEINQKLFREECPETP